MPRNKRLGSPAPYNSQRNFQRCDRLAAAFDICVGVYNSADVSQEEVTMGQRNIDNMSDNELFDSWAEWIDRTSREITEVYNNREIFLHIKLMFDTNPAFCQKDSRHSQS